MLNIQNFCVRNVCKYEYVFAYFKHAIGKKNPQGGVAIIRVEWNITREMKLLSIFLLHNVFYCTSHNVM